MRFWIPWHDIPVIDISFVPSGLLDCVHGTVELESQMSVSRIRHYRDYEILGFNLAATTDNLQRTARVHEFV